MTELTEVRIDKWLWAARFFKTRAQAKQAVENGHVFYNGSRCKPSRAIQVGAMLRIRKAEQSFELEILDLSEQRGPATIAQQLYRESEDSIEKRQQEQQRRKLERAIYQAPEHKPNKQQRRQLSAIKQERYL